MIILIWIIAILILGFVFGEIRHRIEHKKKMEQSNAISKLISNDSMDDSAHGISTEDKFIDFIPMATLSTRGSWRLGQGKTLSYTNFSILRNEEYSKKL